MPVTTALPKQTDPAARIASSLNGMLGSDWVTWEPETLWAELKKAGLSVTEIFKGKIQAIKTLLTTGAFWKDHLAFEKVVMALNDRSVSFDHYQHPSPGMIARALRFAEDVTPPQAWSDEVKRYVAVVCNEEGLILLLNDLAPFQESLDELSGAGRHLREEVSRRIPGAVVDETMAGIQIAKNMAIEEYAGS